ncbi:MAG: hypothetical protein PF689_06515, partial [Deltaproteobacteria bacterium]|nr:hypothetical protein [Deltaproteobacteria bacterium]
MSSINTNSVPTLQDHQKWQMMPRDQQTLFLLSKIDGKATINDIASLCTRSPDDVTKELKKLAEANIVYFDSEEPSKKSTSGEYLIPEQYLVPLECVEKLQGLDEVEISQQRQEEILRVHNTISKLNPVQIFHLDGDYSDKEVKRKFRKFTMRFHPDRYYGKKLGPYKEILHQIFKIISDNYKLVAQHENRQKIQDAFRGTISFTNPLHQTGKKKSKKSAGFTSVNKQAFSKNNNQRKTSFAQKSKYDKINPSGEGSTGKKYNSILNPKIKPGILLDSAKELFAQKKFEQAIVNMTAADTLSSRKVNNNNLNLLINKINNKKISSYFMKKG